MKKVLLATCAFLLAAPSAMFAQEFRGAISGLVTDASGAPLPGAKVTVTEIRAGTKTQTVADSAGEYTAPFLLPGDYEIAAQAPSFKQAIREDVHLGSGDHTVIDVHLEVGDAAQSVSVSADAPLLTSENASVGQAITTKEVEELPLNGHAHGAGVAIAWGDRYPASRG